ncbi:hypothetical protein [Verrucomicrobium sp. BvORR106]|uniref:hypothetical protein n=1 Tax=Verrucomicrobium sp. BvORR106 TaxID=1403819 RepID=UPI00057192AF|nr:hypothetical protein [Verrucomicrobium sp. BvORR106]
MTPSPVIYLSAPTRDLDSTRRQVAELLAKRGCRVLQPPTTGPQAADAEELRRQIQSADMVIQIIGYRSTPFLRGLPPAREMTYLHTLEGDLAAKLNKPVHPIFLTEEFPTDPVDGEEDDPELSERHRYWREFMRSDHLLYIPANKSELSSHIQRLHLGPFNASAVASAYGVKSESPSLSFHS